MLKHSLPYLSRPATAGDELAVLSHSKERDERSGGGSEGRSADASWSAFSIP